LGKVLYNKEPALFYYFRSDSSIYIQTSSGTIERHKANEISKKSVFERYGSFYFHSSDTLFALGIHPPRGYLFNLNDEVVDSFPTKENPDDPYYVFPNTLAPMSFDGRFLVAPVSSVPTFDSIRGEYAMKMGVCIDVKTKEVTSFSRRSSHQIFPSTSYSMSYQSLLVADGKVLFSSEEDSLVYVFDPITEQTHSYWCKSAYIDTVPRFPDSLAFDRVAKAEYNRLSPRYEGLFYSPYSDQYYRMVKHRGKELENNGYYKSQTVSKRSVIIMNENFKVLTEVVIPDTNLWSSVTPLVERNGLWFGDMNVKLSDSGKICLDRIGYEMY
jgi:hypothetical protein